MDLTDIDRRLDRLAEAGWIWTPRGGMVPTPPTRAAQVANFSLRAK